ncbi:Suppressor of cytokine signaling 6-like [Aphelenchoides besseyi]|nr:Suppressor of cytokine signaling 6-like [Aphelenchoides besseyi]KAI6200092.1 Suppressor of cytokine signaling 6-like [Aphelenchoides besseyi]
MHRKRVASRSSNPQPPNERPRFGHWRLDRRMDNQRNCGNRNGDFFIVDSSRRLERDPSEHQHGNCEARIELYVKKRVQRTEESISEEAPLKRRNSDYSQVDGFHMPMPDLTSPVEVAIMEDLSSRMERCRAVENQHTQRHQSSPRLRHIPSALFRVVRELLVSTKRIRIRRRKNHHNKEKKLRTTTANSQLSFLDVDLSRSSFLNDENRLTKSNRRFQLPPNCEPIKTCPIELLYEALIDRSDLPIFPGLYEAASLSYYFGNINRHDAVRILDGQKHGTFLLRDSSHPDYRFAVSFRNNESTVHARIQFNHGRYAFKLDSKRFSSSSLADFITNYKTTERETYDEPYLLHAFSRKEPFSLKYLCTTAIVSKCSMRQLPNLNIPDYVKRTIIEQFIVN